MVSQSISAAVLYADIDLEQRVRSRLAAYRRPGLQRLSIEVRNGSVTLRGQVTSFYEKQLGGAAVQRMADVTSLIDAIVVVDPPTAGW